MASILDSLGEWRDLGTIEPRFDQWTSIGFQTLNPTQIFRFKFDNLDEKNIKTYILARARFAMQSSNTVSVATRIYPSVDRVIAELKIPNILLAKNNWFVLVEIKRFFKKGFRLNFQAAQSYFLTIEEYVQPLGLGSCVPEEQISGGAIIDGSSTGILPG
jgi:hypothetical protein